MIINVNYKEKENTRKIKELKSSNKLLRKDLKVLISEVDNLRNLKDKNVATENEIKELTTDNINLQDNVQNLGKQLKDLANELS